MLDIILMIKELKLGCLAEEERDGLWDKMAGKRLEMVKGGLGLFRACGSSGSDLYFCQSLVGFEKAERKLGFDTLSRGRPLDVVNDHVWPHTLQKFSLDDVKRVKGCRAGLVGLSGCLMGKSGVELEVPVSEGGREFVAKIMAAGALGSKVILVEFDSLGVKSADFSGIVVGKGAPVLRTRIIGALLVPSIAPELGTPVKV